MTETSETPIPELPAECCAKCKFFIEVEANVVPALTAFCRRFPPSVFLIGVNWNDQHTQIIGNQSLATFPNVVKGNWCGEYIPKKEFAN